MTGLRHGKPWRRRALLGLTLFALGFRIGHRAGYLLGHSDATRWAWARDLYD